MFDITSYIALFSLIYYRFLSFGDDKECVSIGSLGILQTVCHCANGGAY